MVEPPLAFLGVPLDPTSVLTSLLGGLGNLAVGFLQYLLSEVLTLVNWIISLLPPLPSWPSGAPSPGTALAWVLDPSHTPLVPMMYAWNYYIMLNLAIVLLFVALGAEAASAAWHFIRWLLTHLPFGLGGGE